MEKTTSSRVAEALEGLTDYDWDKFLFELLGRRGEPRIRRREVQGKNVLEVTRLMVSRFTEAKVVKVTVETLRGVGCNQEAETLEPKTKAPLDEGHPVFRKGPNGQLEAKPLREAQHHGAGRRPLGAVQQGGSTETTWKRPDEVEAEAKARVRSEGGDPRNEWLVLSRFALQVGKYRGEVFNWLLENKLSYVVTLVANHQMEREHKAIPDSLMANKDSLTRYAMAYPDVEHLVRSHRGYETAKERSLLGHKRTALVGFGKYETTTLQDLYESKDKDKISYVDFLRKKQHTCTPGSKMEAAVEYILERDGETASSGPAKRWTPRKRVQTTRSQRTHSQRTRSQSAGSSRYADGSAAGRGRPSKRTQGDRVPR